MSSWSSCALLLCLVITGCTTTDPRKLAWPVALERARGTTSPEEQIALYTRVIQSEAPDPDLTSAYCGRASAYLQTRQFTEAARDCDRAIELDSAKTETYATRGRALLELRQHARAARDFTEAMRSVSPDAELYALRAMAYFGDRNRLRAESDGGKALALDPENARAHACKAMGFLQAGAMDGALREIDKAIELDSGEASFYSLRGTVHMFGRSRAEGLKDRAAVQKATQRCLEDYSKAVELAPDDALARYARGMALVKLGRKGDAMRALTKAIELDPAQVAFWQGRSELYHAVGAYRDAVRDLDKAIELTPEKAAPPPGIICTSRRTVTTKAHLYGLRGQQYLLLGKLDEALSDLTTAIELEPRNATAYAVRGLVYQRRRLFRAAWSDCREALRLNPSEPLACALRRSLPASITLAVPAGALETGDAFRISP